MGEGIYNNSHIYNSVPSGSSGGGPLPPSMAAAAASTGSPEPLPDGSLASSSATCEAGKQQQSDYGLHELLEEPVEEKVSHRQLRFEF